jgi:hypothetical protein
VVSAQSVISSNGKFLGGVLAVLSLKSIEQCFERIAQNEGDSTSLWRAMALCWLASQPLTKKSDSQFLLRQPF